MNFKRKFFAISSIFVLTSCGEITSFQEYGDYIFDSASYVEHFKTAKENILSKYVEPSISDASYVKVIDPMANPKSFSFKEEPDADYFPTYTSILFRELDGYKIHTYNNFFTEMYVSFKSIDDGLKFGKALTDEYFDRPFTAMVSSITNNNINAYHILLEAHDYTTGTDDPSLIKDIFYLLYKVKDLKYDIYFDDANIFMMPKADDFNKKYIEYFIKEKTIHYFDFDKINDYIVENNVVIN